MIINNKNNTNHNQGFRPLLKPEKGWEKLFFSSERGCKEMKYLRDSNQPAMARAARAAGLTQIWGSIETPGLTPPKNGANHGKIIWKQWAYNPLHGLTIKLICVSLKKVELNGRLGK